MVDYCKRLARASEINRAIEQCRTEGNDEETVQETISFSVTLDTSNGFALRFPFHLVADSASSSRRIPTACS